MTPRADETKSSDIPLLDWQAIDIMISLANRNAMEFYPENSGGTEDRPSFGEMKSCTSDLAVHSASLADQAYNFRLQLSKTNFDDVPEWNEIQHEIDQLAVEIEELHYHLFTRGEADEFEPGTLVIKNATETGDFWVGVNGYAEEPVGTE
ncbi:hypothetical protein N9061_02770 [bacterium]|nr:hypothetical protein [bacterium]